MNAFIDFGKGFKEFKAISIDSLWGTPSPGIKRIKYYITPLHDFFAIKKGDEFSLKLVAETGDALVVKLISIKTRKFLTKPSGGLFWAFADCKQIGGPIWIPAGAQ